MPDFQREEVWPNEKKRLLIDTILKGWHLPKFYFRRLDNGLYVTGGFDEGVVTVYYHDETHVSGSILYQPISEANVAITSADCELIGMDIWSGTILAYDGTSAVAAQLVGTVKTGSYFFYGDVMYSEPVKCTNGLYIVGTGGKGEVFYRI